MLYANSILAPCRTHYRAAFRRVAGGELSAHGRGGAAVARNARPYRRLQRFQRTGVEEKIDKTDVRDAGVVVCPGLEGVVRYHHLPEGIAGVPKREGFLLPLLGCGNGIGGLDVHLLGTAIDYKIDFVLSCLMNSLLSFIEHDHADVYGVSAPDEFTVNDILHQVCRLGLAKVDARIPEPRVRSVVLDGIVEIAAPLYIISRGFQKQERIFEAGKIFDDGRSCRFCVYGGLNHVREFGRIGESGNVAHHDVDYGFKQSDILNFVAFHDVLDVNCAVEAAQILFLFVGRWLECTFGKSSVAHVFLKNGKGVDFRRAEIPVFGKGKRRCLNDLSAPAKFCGDIGNEKFGVRACHVGIYVWRRAESAEYAVERDIRRFPIVGMDAGKVDVWWKDLSTSLYFINEYIEPAAIPGSQLPDVLSKFNRIGEAFVFVFFKVNLDDMIFLHAFGEKMPLEQVEEQKTLPASSDAGYDFHEIIVFCRYQLVQQCSALDGHAFLHVFMFMDMSEKLKHLILYHESGCVAMSYFHLYEKVHKDESGCPNWNLAQVWTSCVAFRRLVGAALSKEAA